ncbi:hypothetical protein F5148DRAFT_148083 [Russula earlei]|uniref:Uncharacterized protein n=1 Tax=Russula earlei TaxID=71964 RepID=A0ACC0TRI9_9AGAM|nr:hypothetical protein F5148DRAFT_148083 [Russula earlei]
MMSFWEFVARFVVCIAKTRGQSYPQHLRLESWTWVPAHTNHVSGKSQSANFEPRTSDRHAVLIIDLMISMSSVQQQG